MVPVMPYKIPINAIPMIASVAAIRRAVVPFDRDSGKNAFLGNARGLTEVTPEQIERLSGHKQPLFKVINGNRSHPF